MMSPLCIRISLEPDFTKPSTMMAQRSSLLRRLTYVDSNLCSQRARAHLPHLRRRVVAVRLHGVDAPQLRRTLRCIENHWLAQCTSLASIDLDDLRALTVLGIEAKCGCTVLRSIECRGLRSLHTNPTRLADCNSLECAAAGCSTVHR